MNIPLPPVRLPSRNGLLFIGGVGALGALGVLSTPLVLVLGAAPVVAANIPDDQPARSVTVAASAGTSTSRRRRSTTGKAAAPRRGRRTSTSRRGSRRSPGSGEATP